MRRPRFFAVVASLWILAACEIELPGPERAPRHTAPDAALPDASIDARADARPDAAPGTFCPARPASVEGERCDSAEPLCALCPSSAPCCRRFLVCLDGTWMNLEAGPCEPDDAR